MSPPKGAELSVNAWEATSSHPRLPTKLASARTRVLKAHMRASVRTTSYGRIREANLLVYLDFAHLSRRCDRVLCLVRREWRAGGGTFSVTAMDLG